MKCTIPCAKMVSNEGTIIQRIPRATQDNLTNPTVHCSAALFTRDFKSLETPVPFKVSVAGVIKDVQPTTTSKNGTPMLLFKIVDMSGRFAPCMAFGRHAENPNIIERNEVVIYFTVAQAGLSNGPGQLWIYDDAHVLHLRGNAAVQPARIQMLV